MALAMAAGSRPRYAPSSSRLTSNGARRTWRAAAPRSTWRGSLDELIAPPRHDDLVAFFQGADDLDDAIPRVLDVAEPDRPEEADLFGEVGGRPFRQVAEHLLAHQVGGALQRHGQVLGVDLAEQQLHGPVVELDDVGEHEHPAADLVRQLGVGVVERLEDGRAA